MRTGRMLAVLSANTFYTCLQDGELPSIQVWQNAEEGLQVMMWMSSYTPR